MVIQFEDVPYVVETADGWHCHSGDRTQALTALWVPLPMDHLRVRLWIRSMYAYFHGCLQVTEGDKITKTPLSWPDSRPPEWYVEHNVPANSRAYWYIKEFYSEHEPHLEYIAATPKGNTPCWWETEDTWPDVCRPRSCGPHPVNGSRCQYCGWNTGSAIIKELGFAELERYRNLLEGK